MPMAVLRNSLRELCVILGFILSKGYPCVGFGVDSECTKHTNYYFIVVNGSFDLLILNAMSGCVAIFGYFDPLITK